MGKDITVVLFDADGVLQHPAHDWTEALDAVGGQGFADAVFEHERPAMRGEIPMRRALEDAARSLGVTIDVDEALELWQRVDVDEAALSVVADVRRTGVKAYLVTNQQDVRVATMRALYEGRLDGEFFSCELGVAKPAGAFFDAVLTQLGVAADTCLFIDDSLANVRSAELAGLEVVLHDAASGAEGLRDELRQRGVLL